jgi:hypothetical protein
MTYGEKLNKMVAVLREYHPDATKVDLVEMARHIYDALVGDVETARPMGELMDEYEEELRAR